MDSGTGVSREDSAQLRDLFVQLRFLLRCVHLQINQQMQVKDKKLKIKQSSELTRKYNVLINSNFSQTANSLNLSAFPYHGSFHYVHQIKYHKSHTSYFIYIF